MKTYLRLLFFAKPIEKFAIPYSIYTILSILFNTLNLALLAPLLHILFAKDATSAVVPPPERWYYVIEMFNYYAQKAGTNYGIYKAMQLVCLVLILSVMLSNFFRYLSQKVIEHMRIHTLLKLRQAVFNNVIDLDLSYFSNERKGNIIAKISSDVQAVQYSITGTLQIIFKEPVQLLAYLMILFMISAKLTLFSITVVPLSALVIANIVKRLKAQATLSQQIYGAMISYLDEALSGIRIIKAFHAEAFIKNKFHVENKRYAKIAKSMAKRQQLAAPVSEFLGVLMVAILLLYGSSLVLSGHPDLSAGNFITYIALFSQLMRPAKAISDSFSGISQGLAAGERVLELIDTKPEIQNKIDFVTVKAFKNEIYLKDVSFSYDDKVVLKHIDLKIHRGQMIALVGPSGGGKSTLMDLIPRFIEPQSGEIFFDGVNIQNIKMEFLRSHMGIVNQESILFNDSIFNNIAFGKPASTEREVIHAAKIANAHEFIMNTSHAYQTNIGDRGIKLSGGQKQRICIARAILSNPPIMLFDEATSALDTESENVVQQALNNLMKNRTSLVIAHRLSTIQNADRILVLENGEIVEQGTHKELILKNGVYNKLIGMQIFK